MEISLIITVLLLFLALFKLYLTTVDNKRLERANISVNEDLTALQQKDKHMDKANTALHNKVDKLEKELSEEKARYIQQTEALDAVRSKRKILQERYDLTAKQVKSLLAELPLSHLVCIGPASAKVLKSQKINTILDVAVTPLAKFEKLLKKTTIPKADIKAAHVQAKRIMKL